MLPAFSLLAKFKFLRGTVADPFSYLQERKQERELIENYQQSLTTVLTKLTIANHSTAVAIASLPEKVRGYGHVKAAAMETYYQDLPQLIAQLDRAPEQIVRIMERVA